MGRQQSPRSGQQDDDEEAAEGDLGQTGHDAQQIIRKEGEKEGQGQKGVSLPIQQLQIFGGELGTNDPVGEVFA